MINQNLEQLCRLEVRIFPQKQLLRSLPENSKNSEIEFARKHCLEVINKIESEMIPLKSKLESQLLEGEKCVISHQGYGYNIVDHVTDLESQIKQYKSVIDEMKKELQKVIGKKFGNEIHWDFTSNGIKYRAVKKLNKFKEPVGRISIFTNGEGSAYYATTALAVFSQNYWVENVFGVKFEIDWVKGF